MSEADKMFDELRYKKTESFNLISYDKEFTGKYNDFRYMYTITFDIYNKTFYKASNCRNSAITMQELKAINKKVEELGWLDE